MNLPSCGERRILGLLRTGGGSWIGIGWAQVVGNGMEWGLRYILAVWWDILLRHTHKHTQR